MMESQRSHEVPTRRLQAERILVAIPCYNEELAIGTTVVLARRHGVDVVVIDDGSADRTAAVAAEAGARVVRHATNQGKGEAVRTAFRIARDEGYEALVLLDGDGQHDPEEIPLLVEPLFRTGSGVDVALGFRFGERTQMPAWRKVGKRVLDYTTAAAAGGQVTDSQCGYRAFGRRAIEIMSVSLRTTGFGVESEQLVVAEGAGLRLENVSISCRYEGLDGSTRGPVAHAMDVISGIVELVSARRPLLFLGVPSAILLVAATALGIHTLQSYNRLQVFSVPLALATATLTILGTFGALSAVTLHWVGGLERRIRRILEK